MITREDELFLLKQVNGDNVIDLKDKNQTFISLFSKAAKAFPENPAVVYKGTTYTYDQIDHRTNSLAFLLQEMGAATDCPVGILLKKGPELILSMIAVMKAGAPYLPLDPDYPYERLEFLCEDAKINIIITETQYKAKVSNFNPDGSWDKNQISIIDIDDRQLVQTFEDHPENFEKLKRPEWIISPNDLAYIIYTSGTTGKPKGVMIEHKGLANLCLWQHAYFPACENDNYSLYAPIGFDASVYEIFPALTCGAALHIVPEDCRLDPEGLSSFFNKNNITISFLPPQIGKQMIDSGECRSLKLLTLAGDKPGKLKPDNFKILNCYGPSEFTVCATSWEVYQPMGQPPIGTPISNTHCYIIDKSGFLAPHGITGELCISGVQLARGYHNNKQMTQKSFVKNTFAAHFGESNNPDYQQMYKTGDMCRLRQDGLIEFMGRADDQIKIRGRRIEKGEIEFSLVENPQIQKAIVIRQGEGNDATLNAYVTLIARSEEDRADTDNPTAEQISQGLRNKLPHWMVPASIMILKEFPLTDNGKIDEKKLPMPRLKRESYIAPDTLKEKQLAKVFEAVLHVNGIGKKDDFFNLGGDSIKAMLVVSKLRQTGYILNVKTIFQYAVLEEIAKKIKAVTPQIKTDRIHTFRPINMI